MAEGGAPGEPSSRSRQSRAAVGLQRGAAVASGSNHETLPHQQIGDLVQDSGRSRDAHTQELLSHLSRLSAAHITQSPQTDRSLHENFSATAESRSVRTAAGLAPSRELRKPSSPSQSIVAAAEAAALRAPPELRRNVRSFPGPEIADLEDLRKAKAAALIQAAEKGRLVRQLQKEKNAAERNAGRLARQLFKKERMLRREGEEPGASCATAAISR